MDAIELVEDVNDIFYLGGLVPCEILIGLILPQISNHTMVYKDRNEKWLSKMIAAMREKPTMFVFGSGHLIGECGIIHLLRDAGYEVEQIKIQ